MKRSVDASCDFEQQKYTQRNALSLLGCFWSQDDLHAPMCQAIPPVLPIGRRAARKNEPGRCTNKNGYDSQDVDDVEEVVQECL
eukprot:771455-Amphidinium_carterae.1